MLGGGVFVTQNKVLPGSYINFVNASSAGSTVSDRGVVAIALPLNKAPGTVIEITVDDFNKNCSTILGVERDSTTALPLREIFRHATKVYVYDLGTDGDHDACLTAFEAYDFNVLCVYGQGGDDAENAIDQVKTWRDTMGKKCQAVVQYYDGMTYDHEGIIAVDEANSNLVPWVAGAEAGCALNKSCTNMLYDGELTVTTNKTQAQLEACITSGKIAFHLVYGEVRLLEDINSLVTTTADKGEDFKSNQTIRVVDQIANDIAKLFNTKYLGRIPNNETGRASLWGEIVKHHRQLEEIGCIEYFDSSLLTVAQGNTKKAIVVHDCVTVVNAMTQLYMTVVIQ